MNYNRIIHLRKENQFFFLIFFRPVCIIGDRNCSELEQRGRHMRSCIVPGLSMCFERIDWAIQCGFCTFRSWSFPEAGENSIEPQHYCLRNTFDFQFHIPGLSEVWYRAWFGTRRPWVQVPQPGPSPYAIIDTMVVYGDFLLLLQYPLIWVIS